ncbi:hypothetical protein ANSO36C_02560 [Nostoc cf. commune SO-36]|uniref:Uncharacterized protein n=1 Tax=Nostoc cf. commune SO-36 TaxID=449208 RepID=A0ABM7YV09_NOSCO|nr:hypothetical protein [Nostoc commune]BDI14454.1 hypothetical protein ANSO36C_02560 [Nostoc cf. commune SO-36]
MKISLPLKIKSYYRLATQWLFSTHSRALEQAYSAALGIRDIENEYFHGEKISPNSSISNNVFAYFQTSLNKHLQIIQLRLLEFKVTSSILPESITHVKEITSHQSFHDSNKVYPDEENKS